MISSDAGGKGNSRGGEKDGPGRTRAAASGAGPRLFLAGTFGRAWQRRGGGLLEGATGSRGAFLQRAAKAWKRARIQVGGGTPATDTVHLEPSKVRKQVTLAVRWRRAATYLCTLPAEC